MPPVIVDGGELFCNTRLFNDKEHTKAPASKT